MKNLFIILALFCPALIFSQETAIERAPSVDPVIQLAKTITTEELYRHISILASDEFEGRETGTEGQRKAAKYIAGEFKDFGLPAQGENNTYYIGDKFKYGEIVDIKEGEIMYSYNGKIGTLKVEKLPEKPQEILDDSEKTKREYNW